MKKIYLSFLFILFITATQAQLTGTKNIPGDYATLALAINDLNLVGVGAGGVTLNVVAGNPQTSPSALLTVGGGYVIGGTGSLVLTTTSAANPVIIQGNGNTITAPTGASPAGHVVGQLNDAIIKLVGADWITITGFTLTENAGNTITAAGTNTMTEFGIALFYVTTTDGSQYNTIQNNTISLNRTYQNSFGIYSNARHSTTAVTTTVEVTNATGSNSNNKVYANAISNVNFGIIFNGSGAAAAIAGQDVGNDIGGSSAATGNTITNSGGIGVAASSYAGLTGSNALIFLNHQIGENVSYNNITSASSTSGIGMIGIFKNYATTQPYGTFTTTINYNVITINNNPSSTTAGAVTGIQTQGMSTALATATFNINNNTIQNCSLGGSTSTTNSLSGISNSSNAPGVLNMNNNTILNNLLTATTATTGSFIALSSSGPVANLNISNNTVDGNGISINTAGTGSIVGISSSSLATTANFNNNIFKKFVTSTLSGQTQGININTNAITTLLNVNNNKFGELTDPYVTTSNNAASGAVFGIITSAVATTANLNVKDNDFRNIIQTGTAPTNSNIYIQCGGTPLNYVVDNNTFTNLSVKTSGSITFFNHIYTMPTGGTQIFNNNRIVTAFAKSLAGGTITGFTSSSSSPNSAIYTVTNNNLSNITVTGATAITGIFNSDGAGTSPNRTVTGNTFNNWTGGSSAIIGMTFAYIGATSTIANNILTNFTGTSSITGITVGSTFNGGNPLSISNNTINNFTSSGTGGTVVGIASSNTSPIVNISANIINKLSTTGATSNGINITGATLTNVLKNNIYDIVSTNTTPTVNGIVTGGGTTTNVYNNFISDLRAPNANAAVPIYGINNSGGTNVGIYYNTIALGKAATLTSAGTQFGVTGIGYSSTTNATLRNNIVWIDATPIGTGTVAAVRRSAAGVAGIAPSSTNFNSNNNIYFVDTLTGTSPVVANLNKYLYLEGSVSTTATNGYGVEIGQADNAILNLKNDPNFNTVCGLYKTFMGSRETATFTEDNLTASGGPAFTFVPSGTCFAADNAVTITTPPITDDYSAAVRSITKPDIGALEFAGTSVDAAAPSITFTVLPNTVCTSAPTLTAVITDASGVNVTPGLTPRLYYRKGGVTAEADIFLNYPTENTNAFNGWKYVEATGTAPNFSFAINYSLLTSSMALGDSLTYFVVAQDLAAIPNVGKNAVTFPSSFCPTSVVIPTTGATPTSGSLGYKIISFTTNQPSLTGVTSGSTDNQVLRIDIPASTCYGNITQINFANASTNIADISNARVYYTTTTTFSNAVPFGTAVVNPGATFSVTGTQASAVSGTNYFWLVFDIACAAPSVAGNVADASVTDVVTTGSGSLTPGTANPAGTRTITSTSVLSTTQPLSSSISGGSVDNQVLRIDLPGSICVGNITQLNFGNLSTNVADISNAKVYYTTTTTFSTTTQFGTAVANPGATFSVNGSQASALTGTNYFWLVYDIPCSAPSVTGNTADASIVNMVTSIAGTLTPGTPNPPGTRTITAFVAPVATTNQPSSATAPQGATNVQVLRVDIAGSTCLGNITQLNFTNNSTSLADVTKARVFYTTSTTFSNAIQFGSDVIAPAATFSVTGTQASAASGINYFWLVYDINCGATTTNIVDAGNTGLIATLGTYVPATANPTGTRAITALSVGDNIQTAAVAILGSLGGNIYDINNKSVQTNEPSPLINTQPVSTNGSGASNYSWGTAAGNTQWYRLDVPLSGYGSSGNLILRATTNGTPNDAQLALWKFPNMVPGTCSDPANFTGGYLLAANDDAIVTGSGYWGPSLSGLNSVIRVRLTPGQTYYVQIDGYNTDIPTGDLIIEDLADPSGKNVSNNGFGAIHNPTTVDMKFASYEVIGDDGWTYYYSNNGTSTNIADDVVLLGLNWSSSTSYLWRGVNATGNDLLNHVRRDATSTSAPSTTAPASSTGSDAFIVWSGRNNASAASNDLAPTDGGYVISPKWWMMNKFWNVFPNVQPITSLGVRTFYSDADFTAIQTAVTTGGGVLTAPANMQFIKMTKGPSVHYTNAETDPGSGHGAITAGTVTSLTWTNTAGVQTGINQAQYSINSFSGGGGGSTGAFGSVLPVSIEFLKGTKQTNGNYLDWKVNCTSAPSVVMELERSADGRRFTALKVETATAARCQQGFNHTDATPLAGINYYRLKVTEPTGEFRYSNIIAILNKDKGFELISLAPNPVLNTAMLTLTSAKAGRIEIAVSDMAGRVVAKQSNTVIAGSNPINMNFATLGAGTYTIAAVNADGETKTTRFVKY